MRKLKIFLPSIALIVVLAFSITIGVYAASSVSFSISSTVSFYSPDLKDVLIEAFIGQDITGDPVFAYDTAKPLSETNKNEWVFENDTIKFTRANIGDDYNPAYITFRITNRITVPAKAYFVDDLTNKNHMTADILTSQNGQTTTNENDEVVPLPLVNVDFIDDSTVEGENDSISIVPSKQEETNGVTIITLKFDLLKEATKLNDLVKFDYTLVVDKTGPAISE